MVTARIKPRSRVERVIRARRHIGKGYSLTEAARAFGIPADVLDLSLWFIIGMRDSEVRERFPDPDGLTL